MVLKNIFGTSLIPNTASAIFFGEINFLWRSTFFGRCILSSMIRFIPEDLIISGGFIVWRSDFLFGTDKFSWYGYNFLESSSLLFLDGLCQLGSSRLLIDDLEPTTFNFHTFSISHKRLRRFFVMHVY